MKIDHIREEYTKSTLTEQEVDSDPLIQFKSWLDAAIKSEVMEPTSFTICTTGNDLLPSGRVVLLKGVDERGFVFYTNYSSNKGQDLEENPNAGLVFFWPELQRQVNIQGQVSKVSNEESDEYFYSRPLGSQIGAIASSQSEKIESRELLEQRIEEISKTPEDIKRPSHWGGYLVEATRIEFWQGRPSRLHDRILYERINDEWKISRLSP